MSELEPLIADLALILICAGAMTLLFKRLKQPVVLGYIVAGFLASPNMPYMPSVTDLEGVHLWSEIGVIFLLFALGLEFSFRKILRMGSAPIIAACAVIFGMMLVGMFTGQLFGWSRMDCIYLGGMLAMSSTTIIFKAFDDMGLRQERFANLVLSVLIIEDILAIVLMVMLSTLAVSKEFEGSQMLMSILKLVFFLILWFVVGIYLIPLFLRKVKSLMSNETMLITAVALCFGMVVIASSVGFSAAFGAFIMGSILAETVEAEKIEHLVTPVKDLFGAIFFVSVGMMVDVALITEYIVPILCIIVAIMLGQTILSTGGFLLSGQPLKTAMQCSFSLTQIGEFAFILATLGTSLGVTSNFLYPIVVAVSVFTTFTTPYMIRLAEPAYHFVERALPKRWQAKLESNASDEEEKETEEQQSSWRVFLKHVGLTILIHCVLCMAFIALMLYFVKPFIAGLLPSPWADIVTAILTVIVCSPFLWALMRYGTRSEEVVALWNSGRVSRVKLFAFQLMRLVIGAAFVSYILGHTIHWSGMLGIFVVLAIVFSIVFSTRLGNQIEQMSKTFTENLTERERTLPLIITLLIITLSCGSVMEVKAQKLDRRQRKERVDSVLTARYYSIPYDTNFVVRPEGKLTLKVRLNQTGNDFHVKGTVNDIPSKADLKTSHKTTVSIGASYRGISTALALNPGKLSGVYKDYEFNLNYYSSSISLDFSYQRSSTLAGDVYRNNIYDRLETGDLALKVVNLAGYYTINHRRFSYPAAFTQTYIQRRSAGSWLAGISYQGGSIETSRSLKVKNPDAPEVSIGLGHIGIGGGYGQNWVLGKKWLLHFSMLPTVVVYNRNKFIINGERKGAKHMRFNMIFNERAAIVRYFSSRYFAGLTFVMNNSVFDDDSVIVNQNKWRARAIFGLRL